MVWESSCFLSTLNHLETLINHIVLINVKFFSSARPNDTGAGAGGTPAGNPGTQDVPASGEEAQLRAEADHGAPGQAARAGAAVAQEADRAAASAAAGHHQGTGEFMKKRMSLSSTRAADRTKCFSSSGGL